MKANMVQGPLRLLGSVLILLTLMVALFPAQVSFAHPPLQAGEQPQFVSAAYVAPDGSATIQSQETVMGVDYLAANGSLEGLIASAGGLTLAEGLDSGSYTSGIIVSPLASTSDVVPTWGADIPTGSNFVISTRLRLNGGEWSEWMDNPEAFYPVRDNEHGGSLIWIGGAQAELQFRIAFQRDQLGASPTLHSLTLVFNDTQQGPDGAAVASQMQPEMDALMSAAGISCPPPMPPIISRVAWGCPDGENSPRRPPAYAPVTHVIIHHSATPNNPYQDYAQVVRSIWNYHANCLWWGDIGYNYLIDPNGFIYEGRAGGEDVVGIHDTFNRGSMAIGFIGCYGNCNYLGLSNAQPSQAMLDSGTILTAWKMGQKGIDPFAVTQYDGAGMVPTLAGGRDVTATFSPGDFLYDKLPWMRDVVAQRLNCQGSACRITDFIFDEPEYAVGETIHVTVRVVDEFGAPVSGAYVNAQVNVHALDADAGAAGFDLVDLTGYYQGSYSNTNVPGFYEFTVTASDPIGQRFTPCSATNTASVAGGPIPSGTTISVDPQRLSASWCSFQETSAVSVQNIAGLRKVNLEIRYNPQIVQVVDAESYEWGVQVRLDGGLLSHPTNVLRNEVDTTNGIIYFEAEIINNETIDGNAGLILIDWRPQMPGITPVSMDRVNLTSAGGQVITPAVINGSVEITPDCVSGAVALQGRSDFSGVAVSSNTGAQAQTDAEGRFAVGGGEPVNVSFPGYLSAVADVGTAASKAQSTDGEETSANSIGTITLLAGDVNQDNVIDIFDLATVANLLDTQDPISDLNADGIVSILDLALLGGNFGQHGPQNNWQ